MSNFFRIKLTVFAFAVLTCSTSSFAGLITIDNDVQDIWWWNGIAEANGTELRANDVSRSDQRIGVQFNDLSSLNGLKVVSAELQMYRYSGYWGSDADMTIDAHAMTTSWDESSNIPNYDSHATGSTTYTDAEAKGWQSWNLTELVQGWLMDEVENNGVMLAGVGDNYFQRFYASEKAGYGPRLVINTIEISEPSTLFIYLLAIVGLFSLRQSYKNS